MGSLQHLVKKNGKILNIMDEIGDYKKLYLCLLAPKNNAILDHLLIKCQGMSGFCIIQELFNHWIDEKGVKPVTWRTLISKLPCVGMTVLADEIELQMEGNYPSQTAILEEARSCYVLRRKKDNIQGDITVNGSLKL